MGMKSKVASMQRGARKRNNGPQVTNKELYDVSPPLLTDAEVAHFQFGNRSINDFFLGLSDILKACHHNRMLAGEVAKVLNGQKAKTACGAPWTPRLAWFLMKTWRTVYFAKREKEREAKWLADEKAREESATDIGRAVARQEAHTYQKVLRNYFKNPTLGEIFPALAELKRKLTGEAATVPPKPEDAAVKSTMPRSPEPVAEAVTPHLGKDWKAYLLTKEGMAYLDLVVRLQPRLLELAPLRDERFLGSLRARRTKHPHDKAWTVEEAEQLRSALLLGLNEAGDVVGKHTKK